MDRRAALKEAERLWGEFATVWVWRGTCRVGMRFGRVRFKHGEGATWEGAFEDAASLGYDAFRGMEDA